VSDAAQLLVLMGVSGSGKSTLAQTLSEERNWPCVEGDAFHTPANIEKMTSGVPLTDHDRSAWIDALKQAIHDLPDPWVVLACSALSPAVRSRLTAGLGRDVTWCWLQIDEALAFQRVRSRSDHFMPSSLVRSQFAALQPPSTALRIDASQPLAETLADLNAQLDARSGP